VIVSYKESTPVALVSRSHRCIGVTKHIHKRATAAPPPICPSLAASSRKQGPLAVDVQLDLLGFGFRLLREADLQHAFVIVGAYLLQIHRVGQRERTSEASVLALDSLEILLFLLLLERALAADGERVARNADINVLFVDTRHFNL